MWNVLYVKYKAGKEPRNSERAPKTVHFVEDQHTIVISTRCGSATRAYTAASWDSLNLFSEKALGLPSKTQHDWRSCQGSIQLGPEAVEPQLVLKS